MNFRKFLLVSIVAFICAVPSSRLMAKAARSPEDKCEKAIARKVKAEKKPKKVVFERDSRRSIPHGLLTHYDGKGSYVMRGGERAEFEWFCDIYAAAGKPANLYYTVSKADTQAQSPGAPTGGAMVHGVNESAALKCQHAVASEIRKKKPKISNLAFQPPKASGAGKQGHLLEGVGSFQNKKDEKMKFVYRCLYDKLKGRITSKAFLMK